MQEGIIRNFSFHRRVGYIENL